jgi:hypothetical protein
MCALFAHSGQVGAPPALAQQLRVWTCVVLVAGTLQVAAKVLAVGTTCEECIHDHVRGVPQHDTKVVEKGHGYVLLFQGARLPVISSIAALVPGPQGKSVLDSRQPFRNAMAANAAATKVFCCTAINLFGAVATLGLLNRKWRCVAAKIGGSFRVRRGMIREVQVHSPQNPATSVSAMPLIC